MAPKYRIIPLGGGGITPTGTLDIRSEGVFDVTDYASVDVDIFDDTTTKTITNNGTYNASDDNVLGYSQVTVDVPASAVDTGTLTIEPITQNVNLFTQDVTGYRAIAFEVAVPASEVDTGTKQITSNGNGQDVVGYAAVDVNVPNGTETIQITQNGTYTPTSPNIGFSSVDVNVGGQTDPDYFSATGRANGVGVTLKRGQQSSAEYPVIYKSSDKTNWTLWDGSQISLQNDETVYFYGNNPNGFSKSTIDYFAFGVTANNSNGVTFSGNVMTLLTRYGDMDYIPAYSFYNMFDFINTSSVAMVDDRTYKYFSNLSIPARGVFDSGCMNMFQKCTNLTYPPTINAYSLGRNALTGMFNGCTSLTTAPDLSHITRCGDFSLQQMFYGCTSLTTPPDLSNVIYCQQYCMQGMFSGCTSLTTAPDMSNIRSLPESAFRDMFYGCTSLTTPPDLSSLSEIAGQYCMNGMFTNCISLTTAPVMNIRGQIGNFSMQGMFSGCTSLTTAPDMSKVTTLYNYACSSMFYGCTSLTQGPDLTNIKSVNGYGLNGLFNGCTSLSVAFAPTVTSWNTTNTGGWLNNVASTGTLVVDSSVNNIPTDNASGVPVGWTKLTNPTVTIDYTNMTATITSAVAGADIYYSTNEIDPESQFTLYSSPISIPAGVDYYIVRAYAKVGNIQSITSKGEYGNWFYIEANGDGNVTVSISNSYPGYASQNTLKSRDRNTWTAASSSSETLSSAGDRVYYKRKEDPNTSPKFGQFSGTFSISGTGTVSAGGRLSSLAYPTTKSNQTINSSNAFKSLFYQCTKLTDAENIIFDLVQDNSNYEYVYSQMFYGCTALVKAPSYLPDPVGRYCYGSCFEGCTALATPPILSNSVSDFCYNSMFRGCRSMISAPVLSCTNVTANSCYNYMFLDCSNLNRIEVHATSWNTNVAANWVQGVSATGDFYNLGGATIPTGINGIPSGWTEHTSL